MTASQIPPTSAHPRPEVGATASTHTPPEGARDGAAGLALAPGRSTSSGRFTERVSQAGVRFELRDFDPSGEGRGTVDVFRDGQLVGEYAGYASAHLAIDSGKLDAPSRATSDYWCEPCGTDRALCRCLRYDEIVSLRAEKRDELAHEVVS